MRNGAVQRIAVVLAFALGACGRDETPESERGPAGAAVPAGPLTDAGIVVLVSHVNGSEVGAAKAAFPKLQNAEVRAFAESMIAEHLSLEHGVDSAGVPGDTAKFPPPQFATMQAVSHAQSGALNTVPPGPAFDRIYVAFQVLNHADAADSLRRWHNVARHGELRAALAAALPRVEAHLARAQALQAKLGGGLESGPVAPPAPDTSWTQRTKPADTVAAPPSRLDTTLRRSPPR
jgi:putative membrane protein